MSDAPQEEYPEVLLCILEDLAAVRRCLSFQELCRLVSSRFALEHLLELRSLLFDAASRDPCFPATLFRERVATRGQPSPIAVAADIVTIFNLIQMTGGGPEATQPIRTQTPIPVDQSPGPALPGVLHLSALSRERVRAHSDSGGRGLEHLPLPRRGYSARKRGSLPPDPLSVLPSSPPARARAVSFDLPHPPHPPHPPGHLPDLLRPGGMRSLYLPLETDSESSDSTHGDVFEPEASVGKKRNIFKRDFHNQPPLIPQVTVQSESPSPGAKTGLDNHSFEMIPNPYPSPQNAKHAKNTKHESLDDLQDSTYFGPGSAPESWSPRHLHPQPQKSLWSTRSHSLEDRIGTGPNAPLDPKNRSSPALRKLSPGGGCAEAGVPREAEGFRAQATQTDPPDPRRLRSLVHADRLSFMTSLDDPDLCEDDISAIFRFLDDISMCGSTGVLHGDGGLNQDTPEGRRGRLGQLSRLFHSLESSDDGLKASVCKLLLRMSQIERQLESLAEVKSEISQVLSALQRLDEKIQQPLPAGRRQGSSSSRWLEPLSGVSSFMSHPVTPSESSEPQPLSASGHLYPATSSSSLDWSRWNGPAPAEGSKGPTENKDGLSRRASKNEEKEKEKDWSTAANGKLGQVSLTGEALTGESDRPRDANRETQTARRKPRDANRQTQTARRKDANRETQTARRKPRDANLETQTARRKPPDAKTQTLENTNRETQTARRKPEPQTARRKPPDANRDRRKPPDTNLETQTARHKPPDANREQTANAKNRNKPRDANRQTQTARRKTPKPPHKPRDRHQTASKPKHKPHKTETQTAQTANARNTNRRRKPRTNRETKPHKPRDPNREPKPNRQTQTARHKPPDDTNRQT
ncbi:major intrinsically disordered Notch2-binding receptor 1-like [Boleophthalmus pectinirostris]|uniref:major intrinsically disordered Notch2-binding receptor 1-like n=1 Tax=Boleophthalmus pectinirostris TaxID=150288 RepID=UPI002432136A|nr:major intrinsically disordered Notch2-binding receptor 1-like [Boleophthalmus pectinirostris]